MGLAWLLYFKLGKNLKLNDVIVSTAFIILNHQLFTYLPNTYFALYIQHTIISTSELSK